MGNELVGNIEKGGCCRPDKEQTKELLEKSDFPSRNII